MRFQAPRGTNDVLPDQSHRWIKLEDDFRELVQLYGYREIRTPVFEDTDLFVRSSGETSDIVSKQMYTFLDKGDRSITLKPEGTASTIRAVIEHNLCPQGSVARLSYITPIYRYERPQKGRYREAHQVGLELIGSEHADADAEVIEITVGFYKKIGIDNVKVRVNSLGRDECRARFREAILDYAKAFLKDQPQEIQDKTQKNPLRLLDSKDPKAKEALQGLPPVLDYLEPESKAHFEAVQSLLCEANVPFEVAPDIVRGLDYYTNTVFEVESSHLGAQSALCGGGRYDNLVKELGGPPTPSVGVAMGIERALIVLEEIGKAGSPDVLDVFVVQMGDETLAPARQLVRDLREAGVSAQMDAGRSMKAQLRQADKSGAKYSAILGTDELAKGSVQLRDLASGEQVEVPMKQVAEKVRERA